MGIIPLGIGFQHSLKRRRITMIRLMGLVELRPIGSLKREAAPDNVTDSDTPPADSPDSGDESGMSKAQLMKLSKQSSEVYNMIGDGEDLEAWVQDKVSKASDYMNSVHSHLQYQKNSANTIGNGEGAPADPSMPTDDTLSESVKRISKYKSIVTRK